MAETHTPYSSLKKLLSFLNGVVAVSGVILIALGLGVKYGRPSLTTVLGLSSAYLLHFGYVFLVLGCVIIPLALAGWYGATKESRGTLLFVRDVALEHNFATLRKNYRGYNEPDDFSAQWNLVMEKLKCCGVNNYTDFSGSSFQMTTGHTYPRGCCKSIGTPTCDGKNVSTEVIHQEGCFSKLLKIARIQSLTLSGVSLGAAVIQLPGILATLLLFIKLG
ncbi:tetraspanin-16 isoform X2 [Perognathus longimembris pacificus]|uniref:tetraspanin-16 isoform X2 n=1 Tax=Perognathus longimembris pacificus TaxID=214514 RepID=UPI0020197559|nr:tetraspanin-16 isoform X2 [Perognathus longimembris pacificus]